MNVLILSPKPPYPSRDGSSLAMAQVIEGLAARGYHVTVFFLNTSKHRVTPDELKEHRTVSFEAVTCNTKVNPLAALAALTGPLPYTVSRFINKETVKALNRLLGQKTFDIIQIEGLMMTPYLDTLEKRTNTPVLFRPHNAEHLIWSRLAAEEKNPLKKRYFRRLSKQIKNYEQIISRRFRYLLPISREDAAIFRKWNPAASLMVLPYGITVREETAGEPGERQRLLFLGALDWLPNIRGVEWLLKEVWPALQNNHPGITLHLAGRNPAPAIRQLLAHYQGTSGGRIRFFGEIEDPVSFLASGRIFLVPLFAGSGIRIKILEAMAHGLAVVATSTAVSGLPLRDRHHLMIADTPGKFQEAVEILLNDDAFRARLVHNARLLLKEVFDREHIISKLEKFYRET